MGEDFLLNIIAVLNEIVSKKKIKEGLKGMDNSMFVKVISKLSIALSERQLKKDMKQLNDLYLQIGADLKIDNALKKKLQDRIKILQDNISDLQIKVSTKKSSNIAKAVTETRNKGQRAADKTAISFNIEVKREKAIADLEYIAKKYSKLFSNTSASQKYNNILDAAYGITDAKQLSNVRSQIAAFTSELKANNLASQSLGDKWKSLIVRAKDLFSAASVVALVFSQVKQAVSSFLQLDTAMTNLYKVQDQITSRDQFSGLLTKWNKLAQSLAVTTESLISSMEAWSKIGFDLDMSEQLAEITSIFEKTAEISNEKATSTLISAAQAFTEIDDLGVDDYVKRVEAVGDKINAIGNKYAIDSAGIADGLQNASAALKVAGNDLNETIALITATNKIYQSPDEGSNMLKVASMRLRGQVDALKEMGEDAEGVSTDLTKIQQQVYELTGNKVNIFEDENTLKSTYQMILEIGEVFDSLSDRSQADLLEVMFGKQRASAGAALLLNYEELEKIKNDSINAANSMSEEYSKYMESAEAHITIFKEKLVEVYSTFMSGNLIKYTADLGSGILDLVNSTNLLRHGLVGIISLNIGKGITSVGASIVSTVKQMNLLGDSLQKVKNLPVDKVLRKESLQELGKETLSLTEKNLKLLLSQNKLEDSDKIRILRAQGLSKEEAQLKLQKMGLLSVTKQQTTANVEEAATTSTLKNAMLSLKASVSGAWASFKAMLANNPIGIGLMLASTAASILTTAISKANEKLEETRRANIESATTASESANKLKELYTEYTRLASIQDRTTSEEEAFKTAVENITVALGNKAEVLKNLVAGTDEYADALARATKEELQSQAVTATIGRKSAEEELQGEIWSDWSGSKVSIDSNSKGKSLSEEAQKAVDIVSDSLKEFEIINRTWDNISWDISNDDPTEALEFYNSLVEAREKLVLASGDDEALLDTEIYEDLNTAINIMSESLDTYIEKLYAEEKLNYMAQNGIPSVTEEYKTMESALVSAAGSSVDLQDRFKELLTADFTSLATSIEEVGDAVSDMTEQMGSVSPTLSISDTIDQLNTQIKPAFDSLKSAWQDIFTDDGFALNSIDILSTCDSIKSKLDELNKIDGITVDYSAFEDFVRVLNNSESEANDVKDAFNDLATSITQAGISGAEDFETMKAALEDLGVVNEELVAFDALISNTEALKEAGLDLAGATDEQIAAFANEIVSAENVSQAIAMLTFQKELCGLQEMNTAEEVANLLTLAENAGYTGDVIEYLTELEKIYQEVASGTLTPGQLDAKLARAAELEAAIKESASNIKYEPKVDFSGATKSAKSAGKEAGDQYLKAFQEEYSHLKDQLDRGEISEAQYLNALKALYTKYFRDRKEYLDEFKKYESEYLSGMLDLHNKALSGISTLLNRKIDAANDAKDASISALQEEKAAAEEVYQAKIDAINKEKDAIDKEIKQKNKKIDAINEEVNAIKRTSEARKRDIELQDAQRRKAQAENQRTELKYSESRGFYYDVNTEEIRKANEDITEIQEEMQIAELERQVDLIQKEIDLLEEKKDALTEQQEALQKMLDESNNYYDNLIKQQEQFWDSMIKGMEQQKSKWEELAEIEEIADAYSKVQQVFNDLGYTVDDVLNGNEQAFEDFKSKYISLLSDMNNNASFAEGLSYATGVAEENLGSFLDKTKETADGISDLSAKGSELNTVSEGMEGLATSSTTASEGTSAIATSMGELNTNTEGVSDNITDINDALTDIPETNNLDNLTTSFANLGEAIQTVADALGIGEEGAVSTLVTALQEIGTLSLDGTDGEGVITQFQNLKTAIEDVTSAISGGGSSGGQEGDASTSSSPSMSSGTGGEDVNGLLGAIEEIKSVTDKALGGGGEGEESEGEGSGAIPQFHELKTAVNNVTAAIGIEDSEGSEGSENTLIGALRTQYETASEVLPETKALFEELLESIMACVSALNSMVGLIGSMSEIGGFSGGGSIIPNITPHAKGTVGNAFAKGTGKYKGLPHDEKNALVSEYGQTEMTVLPNGKTIITDKPTMMDLPKDTVIFNEDQTKQILDNKVDAKVVKSYANGTIEYSDGTIITPDGNVLRPLREGDRGWELMKAFEPLVAKIQKGEEIFSNAMFEHQKQMEKWTKEITNNTAINNITNNTKPSVTIGNIHVTCPGVTEQQVAEHLGSVIGKELDKQFSGFHNYTDQMSRIR